MNLPRLLKSGTAASIFRSVLLWLRVLTSTSCCSMRFAVHLSAGVLETTPTTQDERSEPIDARSTQVRRSPGANATTCCAVKTTNPARLTWRGQGHARHLCLFRLQRKRPPQDQRHPSPQQSRRAESFFGTFCSGAQTN